MTKNNYTKYKEMRSKAIYKILSRSDVTSNEGLVVALEDLFDNAYDEGYLRR